jgi:hypothetical protein
VQDDPVIGPVLVMAVLLPGRGPDVDFDRPHLDFPPAVTQAAAEKVGTGGVIPKAGRKNLNRFPRCRRQRVAVCFFKPQSLEEKFVLGRRLIFTQAGTPAVGFTPIQTHRYTSNKLSS